MMGITSLSPKGHGWHKKFRDELVSGEEKLQVEGGAFSESRVNGKFTSDQSLVYNAVLDAQNAVISAMRPGVSWVDMHKLAEKTILESLKKGCLLVGDVDDMMVERMGSIFMPHGLGHLLGIDTHDPGGAERPTEPGLRSLRTSRELLEGMVITVEPGCYFIDALLVPAMESSKTSKFFDREEIIRFRGFGGVRIESDVVLQLLNFIYHI
ncbi:unnamed protein product [Ilex paraguariensis]|uniref:Peptidase M24 domain-containing protein n=1 Tax=Ilex paraguariensis TaxID=185542 RepID=A0ABC8SEV4_9AQUA